VAYYEALTKLATTFLISKQALNKIVVTSANLLTQWRSAVYKQNGSRIYGSLLLHLIFLASFQTNSTERAMSDHIGIPNGASDDGDTVNRFPDFASALYLRPGAITRYHQKSYERISRAKTTFEAQGKTVLITAGGPFSKE
jgi:hypothetical protein